MRINEKNKNYILDFHRAFGGTNGFGFYSDIMSVPDAVALFNHLGYPTYLLPFIGIAKLLGVVAILIPGFPRIKEWAYAGFVFDLTGAMYSSIQWATLPVDGCFSLSDIY